MPDNPFAKYARPAGGPVYGAPPRGLGPGEQERIDLQRRSVENSERSESRQADKDRREAEAERNRQARAYESAQVNIERVLRKIDQVADDATDNAGWFETGTSGNLARSVLPRGTAGHDLSANISTLQANFAFDALQAMREASKTGGALGAITERELKLLEDSLSNIDPGQSHDQFIQNLAEARAAYWQRLRQISPEAAERLSARRGRENRDSDDNGWGKAEVVD